MNYNIIAIEREYASGGREVGEKLAARLNVPHYGQEILIIAAQRYGKPQEYFTRMEEKAPNSFFYSLFLLSAALKGEEGNLSEEDALHMAEIKIIRELAAENESMVFIGRSAAYALSDRRDVLRVFICAREEDRIRRAADYYGVGADKAKATLKKFDQRRRRYYQSHTQTKWNDPANYHLYLNSSVLGIDGCVEAIAQYLAKTPVK